MTERFEGWSKDQITSRLVALESIVSDLGLPTDGNAGLVAAAVSRMTASEGRILLALSDGSARTKLELHQSIYRNRTTPPRMKTIDVIICSIRKKLPMNLRIETVEGPAYRLTEVQEGARQPAMGPVSRRRNSNAIEMVINYLRSTMGSSGMCRASTGAIVAGSGIKGDLHVIMDSLARRKMVSIHERPTAADKRRPWLVYVRARAR